MIRDLWTNVSCAILYTFSNSSNFANKNNEAKKK